MEGARDVAGLVAVGAPGNEVVVLSRGLRQGGKGRGDCAPDDEDRHREQNSDQGQSGENQDVEDPTCSARLLCCPIGGLAGRPRKCFQAGSNVSENLVETGGFVQRGRSLASLYHPAKLGGVLQHAIVNGVDVGVERLARRRLA